MSAPKKKAESSGSPAWMGTFADLMSLLMCFFVLLLSFSEMDLQKYKQVAGSMKMAFGIQREIKADGTPKGTSIIAREYSPGRPQPTVLQVIKQDAVDNTKQSLDFTDAKTESKNAHDIYEEGQGGSPYDNENQNEIIQQHQDVHGQGSDMALAQFNEKANGESELESMASSGADQSESEDDAKGKDNEEQEALAALEAAIEKTQADASKLIQAMEEEINKGMIHIETEGQRILVRIREKGSFPSGSADFKADFLPVLEKLRGALSNVPGKLLVAGHTDDIPIHTARFRSNWELSSSRAVSVVHELLKESSLIQSRFLVEGHGDASPLAPNDTTENRAMNRRVELTIVQGGNIDEQSEQTFEDIVNQALSNELEIVKLEQTEPITEQNPFSESAEKTEDMALAPEVSVNSFNNLDTQAEQIHEEIVNEEFSETVEIKAAEINESSLEQRIKKFTERMERNKNRESMR